MINLEVDVSRQRLYVKQNDTVQKDYLISTGKAGVGEEFGSEKTPRGKHIIRAKIGAGCLPNTVFRARRPTGEIYDLKLREQFPNRDWILTRIFWLSGLELHKNRLGKVDTMRRYIYIHGTPDDVELGKPGSRGCVRMRNSDIIELFEYVPVGVQVIIQE